MSSPSSPQYVLQATSDRPRLWRYLVGLLLVIAMFAVGQFASLGLFFAIEGNDAGLIDESGAMDIMAVSLHPALALVLYLILPFGFGIIGLWMALTWIHQRSFMTLISDAKTFDWKRYFVGFFLWLGLAIVMELISYGLTPEKYTFSYEATQFWPLVLVGFIFFPIQTSSEELIFRGYLFQGFSIGTLRIWMSILFTAILFGLLHGANPEVLKYGPLLLGYYIGVGILLGVCTWMDQRIELALGLHAANNFFAAVFVTFTSSAIQTPALFRLDEPSMLTMVILWTLSALIFLGAVARIYQWTDWQSILKPLRLISPGRET